MMGMLQDAMPRDPILHFPKVHNFIVQMDISLVLKSMGTVLWLFFIFEIDCSFFHSKGCCKRVRIYTHNSTILESDELWSKILAYNKEIGTSAFGLYSKQPYLMNGYPQYLNENKDHILFYHTEKKAWVVNIAKISHEFKLNEFPFLETAVTYSDCPSVETNTWKWIAKEPLLFLAPKQFHSVRNTEDWAELEKCHLYGK